MCLFSLFFCDVLLIARFFCENILTKQPIRAKIFISEQVRQRTSVLPAPWYEWEASFKSFSLVLIIIAYKASFVKVFAPKRCKVFFTINLVYINKDKVFLGRECGFQRGYTLFLMCKFRKYK